MIVVLATLIPAVEAAWGLAPTARMAKPVVERSSSHHTARAASSAITKPRCSWPPSSRGRVAFQATIGEIGSLRPGRWNSVVVSR